MQANAAAAHVHAISVSQEEHVERPAGHLRPLAAVRCTGLLYVSLLVVIPVELPYPIDVCREFVPGCTLGPFAPSKNLRLDRGPVEPFQDDHASERFSSGQFKVASCGHVEGELIRANLSFNANVGLDHNPTVARIFRQRWRPVGQIDAEYGVDARLHFARITSCRSACGALAAVRCTGVFQDCRLRDWGQAHSSAARSDSLAGHQEPA